jgi:hypothetical protein
MLICVSDTYFYTWWWWYVIRAENCSFIDTNGTELLSVAEYALVNVETSLHKRMDSVKTEHIFPTVMPSCCEGLLWTCFKSFPFVLHNAVFFLTPNSTFILSNIEKILFNIPYKSRNKIWEKALLTLKCCRYFFCAGTTLSYHRCRHYHHQQLF